MGVIRVEKQEIKNGLKNSLVGGREARLDIYARGQKTISEGFSGIRCGCDYFNYCNFVWVASNMKWFNLCEKDIPL